MSNKRRVVITGIGMLTPLGLDTESSWQAIRRGEIGIAELTRVQREELDIALAAELKNFKVTEYIEGRSARRMDEVTQYGLIAAREAFRQSGLQAGEFDSNRAGVIFSTGIGGINTFEREKQAGIEKGYNRVSPFFIPLTIANMTAGTVAQDLGLHGLSTAVITACAASTNGLGEAFHKIRDGYLDIIVAGGAEAAITPMGVGGFSAMRALSKSTDPKRASIPFDAERDGFVIGEGAGALILEDYEHAKKRGAKILGEVVGYGSTSDAYHMTAPDPEGTQAARCLQLAVEDADIKLEDIGYINAHGTSTELNDASETHAIRRVFGDHADQMKVSSTKSMTGHLLGASGVVEAAFCVLGLKEQWVPPTMGLEKPDPDCDLDYVANAGEDFSYDYALKNSLGFGGHNASIVLKRYLAD
ncbi:MAG TPA: beta-ketoacyl-ACP synthase II [Oscillospiraceae bacterium]|nr:beta-ketoacyl-ACP synthase II [Oscillospiraceae bacterium]